MRCTDGLKLLCCLGGCVRASRSSPEQTPGAPVPNHEQGGAAGQQAGGLEELWLLEGSFKLEPEEGWPHWGYVSTLLLLSPQ